LKNFKEIRTKKRRCRGFFPTIENEIRVFDEMNMHVAVNCDDKCKLGGDEKYWQSMEIEQMHRELQ